MSGGDECVVDAALWHPSTCNGRFRQIRAHSGPYNQMRESQEEQRVQFGW